MSCVLFPPLSDNAEGTSPPFMYSLKTLELQCTLASPAGMHTVGALFLHTVGGLDLSARYFSHRSGVPSGGLDEVLRALRALGFAAEGELVRGCFSGRWHLERTGTPPANMDRKGIRAEREAHACTMEEQGWDWVVRAGAPAAGTRAGWHMGRR